MSEGCLVIRRSVSKGGEVQARNHLGASDQETRDGRERSECGIEVLG